MTCRDQCHTQDKTKVLDETERVGHTPGNRAPAIPTLRAPSFPLPPAERVGDQEPNRALLPRNFQRKVILIPDNPSGLERGQM